MHALTVLIVYQRASSLIDGVVKDETRIHKKGTILMILVGLCGRKLNLEIRHVS